MFDHPFSQAVRQEFLHSIRRGVDASLAVTQLKKEYGEALERGATGCRFLCAISFAAWQCGVLYESLQAETLQAIEEHSDALARMTGDRHVSTGDLWRLSVILRRPQPRQSLDLTNAWQLRQLDLEMRDLTMGFSAA